MNHTVADRPSRTTDRPAVRSPWQVRTLVAIVTLLALVTSYGAIYFTFFFEDPDPGLGSWVFVTVFLGLNLTAVAAVRAVLSGSGTGRKVLIGWTVLGMLWCVAKLVFWHETESLVFGVLDLACLLLLLAPRTRRHSAH